MLIKSHICEDVFLPDDASVRTQESIRLLLAHLEVSVDVVSVVFLAFSKAERARLIGAIAAEMHEAMKVLVADQENATAEMWCRQALKKLEFKMESGVPRSHRKHGYKKVPKAVSPVLGGFKSLPPLKTAILLWKEKNEQAGTQPQTVLA